MASVVTAATLAAALWVQHSRQAWPFAPVAPAEPAAAAGDSHDMQSMTPPTRASGVSRVPIDVNETTLDALGIRVEAVTRQSLAETVRIVATVVPDESRISQIHTRVAGWIEQLDVNTTGELVRAGQPLARIFSQELFSSQAEYLAARKATQASGITSAVVASGRTRLMVLGMSAADVDEIERTGEPKRLVTVIAPRSGVVMDRGVTVGTSVDPSTTLLTIVDLSRVWILAEVPETSIPAVRVGMSTELDFPASGRQPFPGRVDFIYPTLTDRTRTLRVRISASNPNGALRPGLYGSVSLQTGGPAVITVPRDAVVDTGSQQHVFVVSGKGFEPRTVILGLQLADRVEIREGLQEGERIAASGVFLLDSESRLRATGGAAGSHSGHGSAAPQRTLAGPAKDPHAGHRN
jgi:Cu(I)/Ag(I) efflux system membrane fusion protein